MKLLLILLLNLQPDYYCYQYTLVTMDTSQYHLNEECYPCSFEMKFSKNHQKVTVTADRYTKTFHILRVTNRPDAMLVTEEGFPDSIFSIREDHWGDKMVISVTPIRMHSRLNNDIAEHGLVVSTEHIKGLCFND